MISYFTSSEAHGADGTTVIGFNPTPYAVGPWADDMLHGRFFGALAARAIENEHLAEGWRVSRLTVDMFRPAGFEVVTVVTSVLRAGRRIKVVDAEVTSGEHLVASVRSVILAEGEPPPGDIWQPDPWESPHPETLPAMETQQDPSESGPDGLEESAWDIRLHTAGFGVTGQARVWSNEQGYLVDEEETSPLVRAALSGDLASPLANGGEGGIGYINADYTLAMARYPVGVWVGLETSNHMAADGIALGACTLYDVDGPFATSTTTALANPVLPPMSG